MSGEFARDSDDDDRARLASGLECVPALVQPPSAALSLRLHSERLAVSSALKRDASTRRRALVPGGLDQQPAYVAVAGFGDRALAAPLPARVFAWGEPEERAERLGPEPVPVAEFDRQRERRSVETPRRQTSRSTTSAYGGVVASSLIASSSASRLLFASSIRP